nr:methyltransferase [Desulfobulbus alkaliphilus]
MSCRQGLDGYRFSVDAVLAAHFTVPRPGERVLDLGCGCGVIALIMAYRHPTISCCGLEVQDELAALSEENITSNGFADRFRLVRGDVRNIAAVLSPETFDLVVCNPPYRKKESGRINPGYQASLARHELAGGIEAFVSGAAFAVRNRGRVVFVYPAARSATLLCLLHRFRLVPKRLQPIYSYPGGESARLVLVEAVKNGGEQMELLAPFYIFSGREGDYTPAMRALYH